MRNITKGMGNIIFWKILEVQVIDSQYDVKIPATHCTTASSELVNVLNDNFLHSTPLVYQEINVRICVYGKDEYWYYRINLHNNMDYMLGY